MKGKVVHVKARRVRLYLRLLGLAYVALRRPPAEFDRFTCHGYRRMFSLAEAIHRDLGHRYNPDLIRPEHEGPVRL